MTRRCWITAKSPALDGAERRLRRAVRRVGTLVSSLVDFASPAGQVDNVSEVDSGALLGIAVTAADTTNGSWYYSTNNGTNWNALGAVASNNARLLAADANTRLYFQPNANYHGTLATAITFRAWDQDQRQQRHAGRHHQQRRHDGLLHGHRHRQPGDQPGGRHAVGDQCHDQRGHADDQRAGDLRATPRTATEVTHFKITGISNGTLYQNDGTTQITNGTFITFAQGNAGLKFTPTANFNGSGSFTVQASTSNGDAGLGGSTGRRHHYGQLRSTTRPVLDNTKSPASGGQNEDSAHRPVPWAHWSRPGGLRFARRTGGQRQRGGQRGSCWASPSRPPTRRNGTLVVLDRQRHELERPGSGGQ